MKKLFSIILLTSSIISTHAQNTTIHLSPQGSDQSKGTQPIYSLNEAVRRVSQMSPNQKDTVKVIISKGTYYMHEPLQIESPLPRPIHFVGENPKETKFIGGMKIENWQPHENGLWKAYIPQVKKYGFSFEQFYVNDQRATMARTPNKEWYFVKGSREQTFDKGVRYAKYATQQIEVDTMDLASLKNLTEKERKQLRVLFYHKWDVTRKNADFISLDSGVIHTRGEAMKPWNAIGQGARYVLENYLQALDAEGEWYLDRSQGWVYYKPKAGEDMSTATCYAPVCQQLVVIQGTQNEPVKDVTFENLTLSVSGYKMPSTGNEPMQAAAFIEAAVEIDLASNITFKNCEITNTGAYAIWLRREANHCLIEECLIENLGAGGIKIGEPFLRDNGKKVSHSNIINNNIIRNAGHVFPCGVGVAILNGSDNQVTHNDISNLRYSGVSVGWMWGYNGAGLWTTVVNDDGVADFKFDNYASPSVRNNISYNHIHHIGWGELSDMGAVYTLGESPGTTISNNVIHDVYSYDYGGWGLYTDEGSTHVTMKNNLVWGCKSGGFHQHYGKENTIENNIFAFGHYYQLQFTRVEAHQSFSFKHNIILQDCGVNIAGAWKDANIDMDKNCWYDLRGEQTMFGEMNLNEWQKIKDQNSVVENPLFVDPYKLDFRLKSNKVARKIGFEPFDYSKAGVYGSIEWIENAKLPHEVVKAFEEVILRREKEHSKIYQ